MKDEACKSGQRRQKDEILSLSTQQKPTIKIEAEGNKEDEEGGREGVWKERKRSDFLFDESVDYCLLIDESLLATLSLRSSSAI